MEKFIHIVTVTGLEHNPIIVAEDETCADGGSRTPLKERDLNNLSDSKASLGTIIFMKSVTRDYCRSWVLAVVHVNSHQSSQSKANSQHIGLRNFIPEPRKLPTRIAQAT